MEGTKLDIASKEKEPLTPAATATYKQIHEDDMEDANEADGADEKMLSNDETKMGPNSNINLTEIKFTTNEKNGDAKLDIGEVKNEFVGLTKEELLKCANDPFWVNLRRFLFASFWILWAGMLIGAIMIIVAAPKCTPPTPKTWWEEGPISRVDADDSSSLAKLTANADAALLVTYPLDTYTPLNTTPAFATFLANYKDVNVIVELNPTVSDVWFPESDANMENYSDYYIWRGTEGNVPNNWLSPASTDDDKRSAWKYSSIRKQYFLALDDKPQLNFRNKHVREEFTQVLDKLLAAGVDGFALKNVPSLLVDADFADETPKNKPSDYTMNNYNFYTHFKTVNLLGLTPILHEWRNLIKNKTTDGVLMLTDSLTTLQPYKFNDTLLVDLPKKLDVFELEAFTAQQLVKEIDATYNDLDNAWPAWKVGSNADFPNGTLATVAYLLKGSTILETGFQVKEELKEARKSPSVLFGTQKLYTAANDTVFAYVRTYPGNPGYLVAFNPTDERVVVDFPIDVPVIPEEVTVQYFSANYNETDVGIRLKKHARLFPISAKSAIILSYVPK